ncbi:MAG: RidA family protein [Pseudomonadota bacterium]
MAKKRISTGSPFERSAGYSRAMVCGDRCYVSGTTGYDYATMIMPDDVAAQTRNALATIDSALAQAGFSMADVVQARYYVASRDDTPAVFEVLGEIFGEIRPAATMIIADLIEPQMKVEIEVVAEHERP